MNIDMELENIISKYNFHKYYLRNFILDKIKELICEAKKTGKMGIVGAGRHTMHLLNDFKDVLPDRCILIDYKWDELSKKGCYKNVELSSYDKVNELDVVIVSSYDYRKEMTQKVREMRADIKIIDIYSVFEDLGVYMTTEYYNTLDDSYPYYYYYLILLQQQIENEVFESKWLLQDIIFQFLQMRDLNYAKKYIQLYLKYNHDNEKEYRNLKIDLEELEKKIQAIIKKRRKKDIIWIWQDGLRYDTSLKMPYLNKCRSKGLDLRNAYTVSDNTRNVYAGILERKSECDIYIQQESENKVSKLLKEQGYAAYKIWDKDDWIPLEDFVYRKKGVKSKIVELVQASLIYWEVLKLLLESDTPVFAIVHPILETHEPFCAPILKEHEMNYARVSFRLKAEGRKKFDEIYLQSALYLDSLNEYFAQFFPKDCVRIYMSDHGCILNENSKQFTEELVHVPFVVTGGEIKHKESESLFSLKNFYEMLEYILEGNEDKYNNLFSEYLDINGIDLYGKVRVHYRLECGLGELHIAYCGIRTLEDVYILEATGDEYYGSPKDIKKLECVLASDALRVEELRKMCKKNFVDISKDEIFKESHKVYQAIGKERKF